MELAQLDSLDFASWKNPWVELDDEAPEIDEEARRVLTLRRLLEAVSDYDRKVDLAIETKHPTRYAGLVETTLVKELNRFGWAGRPGPPDTLREPPNPANRVIVMSFAPTAVRRVRLLAPDIPTVLLLERLIPPRKAAILPVGVSVAGPGLHVLRGEPEFVARAHARGHQVFVWTVDEPADVEFVLDLGVDTIITDHPLEVRQLLDAR
jgi:glycerophosphoryl diester phosphodiesterase